MPGESPLHLLEPGALLGGALFRSLLARAEDETRLPPGTRLGPFRILGEIGAGGMGVVYLAERCDGQIEQRVAVKTVQSAASELAHELFTRERQILADFRHANVARLLDGGSRGDGLLWCAMELVEGVTLDAFIADRAPPLDVRLTVVLQLCDVVSAAHARALLHRDIKPRNVMVDADGSAKLLDFGIATWTHPAANAEAEPPSQDRLQAYTPNWASPEQLRRELVGPASDQHQLGQLLRFVIADRLPTGTRRIELQSIIRRATDIEPERRYGSVREFADDIQRWIARRPVRSMGSSPAYTVGCAMRRHPWQAGSVVLVLLVAVLATVWNQHRLQKERDLAIAAQIQAQYESQTARAINGFLLEDLLPLSDPNVSQDAEIQLRTFLQRAAAGVPARFHDRPEVAVQLHTTLGRSLRGLDEFESAQEQFEQAHARAAAALPDNDPIALEAQLWHADLEIALTQYQAAHERLSRLLDAASNALGPVDPLTLSVQAMKLTARFDSGVDQIDTLARLDALQPQLDSQLGVDATFSIRTLARRAQMYNSVERLEQSEQLHMEHIERVSRKYGPDHSATHLGRLSYAVVLGKLRRPEQAITLAEQSRAALARIFGTDSVAHLAAKNVHSRILFDLGRIDESIALVKESLAGRIARMGPDHDHVAESYLNMGGILVRSGRIAEGIDAYRESLRIREARYPSDHVDVLTTRTLLGDAYRQHGDLQNAVPLLDAAVEGLQRTLSDDRPELANARYRWAQLQLDLGRPERARLPLEQSLAVFARIWPPEHPRRASAAQLLAELPPQ